MITGTSWGVVIPAYCPSADLPKLISQLLAGGANIVVLLDDGSPVEYGPIFTQIKSAPGVAYISHDSNRGKGAALKTGFQFIVKNHPDIIGVVTADADGQHTAEDIIRIANRLVTNHSSMILGVRSFSGKLPWRSWFGNTLTRKIFGWLTGQQLSDTQTGLRGIPASWLPWLVALQGDRYEYEINMLLETKRRGLPIIEEPITTIYEAGNPSSHFNPITDSFRIYRMLLGWGRHLNSDRLIKLPPDYLKSIATVSDRMPKLYYHPIKIARDFFWQRLAVLIELADQYVKERGRCLDFACGSGIFLPTLSRMFKRVVGIDLEMTEARRLVSDYRLNNIQLIEQDIATAQLDGQFSAIFAADVLEHFSDLALPVEKIKQWLKPDGVLLTSLPTENFFTRLTRLVGGHQKPWDHYYTGREVENFLLATGFTKMSGRLLVPIYPLYRISVWSRLCRKI